MEFHEFNHEFTLSRARLRAGETSDVAAEQQLLRALVASLPTDHERKVAAGLITRLAEKEQPRPADSPEMIEAVNLIERAADAQGTIEERLAFLADTRQKVWAIAARAGSDSAAIQALTRMLDSQEEVLTDPPPWLESTLDERDR